MTLQYSMRISQRQLYHRSSLFGVSYLPIMSMIAEFFNNYVRFIDRVRPGLKHELAYLVRTGSYNSNYIMVSCLIQFPMFTYKHNCPYVFSQLLQLTNSKGYKNTAGAAVLTDLRNLSKDNSKMLEHINKSFYDLGGVAVIPFCIY